LDNSAESSIGHTLELRVSTASEEVAAFTWPFLLVREKKDANIAGRARREEGECQWQMRTATIYSAVELNSH
jgi:hypothetical protein